MNGEAQVVQARSQHHNDLGVRFGQAMMDDHTH